MLVIVVEKIYRGVSRGGIPVLDSSVPIVFLLGLLGLSRFSLGFPDSSSFVLCSFLAFYEDIKNFR